MHWKMLTVNWHQLLLIYVGAKLPTFMLFCVASLQRRLHVYRGFLYHVQLVCATKGDFTALANFLSDMASHVDISTPSLVGLMLQILILDGGLNMGRCTVSQV
jgi:hypothetical protein